MKHFMNRWLLLFVLLLGMSALACNLPFGGEDEPTAVPATNDAEDNENRNEEVAVPEEAAGDETTPEMVEEVVVEEETAVTEEPTEAETTEENTGLFSGLFPESLTVRDTVQQFDTLNSYEMTMMISTTVSETTQVVEATIQVSTDPAASYMTFSFSGFDEAIGASSMSMTQVDGITYMNMFEFGCVTSSEGDLTEDFNMLDANDFLAEVGEANLVGEETINGIETLHYTFDESAITDGSTEYDWAQGDVYIAKEGNFVVRFQVEGEGPVAAVGFVLEETEDATQVPTMGLTQVEMNLTNINEPVNITIPEECENSGAAASEFPVLEDAYESSSFGGIVTYKTATSFADAVAFYQDSLAADGWTYDESSFILENSTALMNFDKDGRSLTVTITEETGTDAFTVVLFEE
jgi:hypothetical protein